MDVLFANNAKTLLDGQILDSALSAVVDDGSLFPSPTGGQYFYATLQNPSDDTDYEIVKVTARSTNTLTIERAQEGTSAKTWADGTLFELRLTAGGIAALQSHEADHVSGGSAEIDGDKLDVDWNPSYYTPATTPSEAGNVDHLAAHLYGIDQAIKPSSQDARGTIEIATLTEAKAGSETGMAITPSTLDGVLKQQSWIQGDGYYIGTDTIRARDGDGLNLQDDGGNGLHIADGGAVSASNLTASRALQTNGSKALESSAVTSTELGYLSGVTSGVQSQLNEKAQMVESDVNDEAEITLDPGKTGWGFAMAGDNEEWMQFSFTAAGVVTVIANSANAVNTDADGNLCVYDAGSGITIKNRLGATKTIRYMVNYSA